LRRRQNNSAREKNETKKNTDAQSPEKILHLTCMKNNKGDVSVPSYSQTGSCHKRHKPQAPTPKAPIRNRQTRKVANAKGLNGNTNLT